MPISTRYRGGMICPKVTGQGRERHQRIRQAVNKEQLRIKGIVQAVIDEAKYPLAILGSPLKADQTGYWQATLLHTSTDRRVEIRFEDTYEMDDLCKQNAHRAIEAQLGEMGLLPGEEVV